MDSRCDMVDISDTIRYVSVHHECTVICFYNHLVMRVNFMYKGRAKKVTCSCLRTFYILIFIFCTIHTLSILNHCGFPGLPPTWLFISCGLFALCLL